MPPDRKTGTGEVRDGLLTQDCAFAPIIQCLAGQGGLAYKHILSIPWSLTTIILRQSIPMECPITVSETYVTHIMTSRIEKMTIITVRVVNTYGGSPLNRLSWLRTSHSFLNAVVELPGARWMLFKSGQPLFIPSHANKESFTYLRTQDVAPLLGSQPYFGQGQNPGDSVTDEDVAAQKHSPLESIRHIGAPVVFLGVNETERDVTKALPTSELKDPVVAVKKLHGEPYFALDVAELGWAEDETQEKLDSVLATEGRTYTWAEPRSLMSSLDSFTAAVFASARSMLDWNLRNKVSDTCVCGLRL